MLALGGSSSRPLSWSPIPARPMPKPMTRASNARVAFQGTGRFRRPSTRNMPADRPTTMAARGAIYDRDRSSWDSPTTAIIVAKPMTNTMPDQKGARRACPSPSTRPQIPTARPVKRAPTITVALLKNGSLGDSRGRLTRTPMIPASAPPVSPAWTGPIRGVLSSLVLRMNRMELQLVAHWRPSILLRVSSKVYPKTGLFIARVNPFYLRAGYRSNYETP